MIINPYIFSVGIPYGNIVSHWRFDANSNDFVGSNNGTDTDITYASGKVSNAAGFNGTSSKISFGNLSTLRLFTNGTNDIAGSITGWLKFNSTSGTQYILDKRDLFNATLDREYFILYTSGELRFVLFDQTNGGNIRVAYSWTPTTGVWYHFAATYDGSGTSIGMKLYINGVSVGAGASAGTYVKQVGSVGYLMMGSLATGASYFNGATDEFTFWDLDLTPVQIGLIKDEGDLGNQIA